MNKVFIALLSFILIISVSSALKINEFVVDPQTNWDQSGTIGDNDEWIELFNEGTSDFDLTNWKLVMNDSLAVNASVETLTGTILPNSYKTILNPAGSLNFNGQIQLFDSSGVLVDSVTYGNWNDGNLSDNAPTANSNSAEDECLARIPNGQDTNLDSRDFVKTTCTYNKENKVLMPNEQGLDVTIAGKIMLKILPRYLDFGIAQPGSFNNSALNGPITFNATGSTTDVKIQIVNVTGYPFSQGLRIDNQNPLGKFWSLIVSSPVQSAIPTLDVPSDAVPGSNEGTIVYMITGQTP